MLASLIKDGSGIKLFDIKDYVNANNDLEPAIIDRIVNPFDCEKTFIYYHILYEIIFITFLIKIFKFSIK